MLADKPKPEPKPFKSGGYVRSKLGMTSAGHINAIQDANENGKWRIKYTRRPMLFTTKDGRVCAITRDSIDKGLPQAAGIPIVDGDKLNDDEPQGE